jgi:hypothetical protein
MATKEFSGLTFEEAANRSREIIEYMRKNNVPIRMLGSLAISLHSLETKKHCEIFLENRIDGLKNPFTDLDFVGYSKDRDKIGKLLEELGYYTRGRFTAIEFDRMIYRDKSKKLIIDVFLDKLSMCHTINFKGRLELDDLSVPLADLLLTKMQIHDTFEKDIKDSITLLLDHPLGDNDNKMINYKHIAETLTKDWGFYYTTTTNLKKIKDQFQYLYKDKISSEEIQVLHSNINTILDAIEKQPKSLGWKMRAKIGTKKKWYEEVDLQ